MLLKQSVLGLFYFGQDGRLRDEQTVIHAAECATDWLLEHRYSNVLVEIANEVDVPRYEHAILCPERCHDLVERVKSRSAGKVNNLTGRLLVSASTGGGSLPPDHLLAASDMLLLHGNGVSESVGIGEMVRRCRQLASYRSQPILFNEDDHFGFDREDNSMLAAIGEYAGWGYFDYRLDGEGLCEGYQSVPVDWAISSERKRGFFDLLASVTGYKA